jgi:hypothetical protein
MRLILCLIAISLAAAPSQAQVRFASDGWADATEKPEQSVIRLPIEVGSYSANISPDSLQQLRLGDGSRHIGYVVELQQDRIIFETISGVRIEANRAFARLTNVRGRIVEGEFWPEDRNATRLFFAPTGRSLRTGEGYAGAFLMLPFVAVGATDDVTLAGGMPPFGSLDQIPIWIAPKLRVVNLPRTQASVGLLAVNLPGHDSWDWETSEYTRKSGEAVGVVYGISTFGDLDNALHAGAGVAFSTRDGFGEVPLMVGGEMRMSRRNKLITENWYIPGTGGAISGGVRIMGDRWTTDLGWAALLEGEVPYLPVVSFSYNFGGR